ncbi:hypothetical protein GGF43_005138 [Coemansia sp. RSA 2618]|nr:hypothetical protein GGF43_005138 [Coemansia sp. RSA 2618]
MPGPWYTKLTGIERKYHAWQHKEHHYFLRMFEKYGPIVRVGPTRVGVGEITMFRDVMSTHEITKAQMYTHYSIFGENIFNTRNPEFYKARRRQIGPAFASAYVRKMEPLLRNEGVESLCRLFDTQISAANLRNEDSAVTNLYFALSMMATDIISSLAYGRRFSAVDSMVSKAEASPGLAQQSASQKYKTNKGVSNTKAQESAQTILEYMLASLALMGVRAEAPFIDKLPLRMLPHRIQNLYALCDKFIEFTCSTVAQYRAQISQSMDGRNDILSAYITARDPETGETLSDYEIGSECVVLLTAGTETVASTMVNCVRLLLRNPDKYNWVRNELRAAFPGGAETISYTEALEKLPYLIAVIYETMRLRSSNSGVWPRDAPRHSGVTIGGYSIPPGTVICGSIGGVHLNPDTWSQPKKFVPERFLGEDGEQLKRNVVGFSSGVRVCPGKHLAMMEMTMTLSTILLKYDFALISDSTDQASDKDYYTEVDELCHITTSFRNPERDCNYIISHSNY